MAPPNITWNAISEALNLHLLQLHGIRLICILVIDALEKELPVSRGYAPLIVGSQSLNTHCSRQILPKALFSSSKLY